MKQKIYLFIKTFASNAKVIHLKKKNSMYVKVDINGFDINLYKLSGKPFVCKEFYVTCYKTLLDELNLHIVHNSSTISICESLELEKKYVSTKRDDLVADCPKDLLDELDRLIEQDPEIRAKYKVYHQVAYLNDVDIKTYHIDKSLLHIEIAKLWYNRKADYILNDEVISVLKIEETFIVFKKNFAQN